MKVRLLADAVSSYNNCEQMFKHSTTQMISIAESLGNTLKKAYNDAKKDNESIY